MADVAFTSSDSNGFYQKLSFACLWLVVKNIRDRSVTMEPSLERPLGSDVNKNIVNQRKKVKRK